MHFVSEAVFNVFDEITFAILKRRFCWIKKVHRIKESSLHVVCDFNVFLLKVPVQLLKREEVKAQFNGLDWSLLVKHLELKTYVLF